MLRCGRCEPDDGRSAHDAIFDRFELLVEQPRMGRKRPEFGEGVRSFIVERYVIYYRHDPDVLIARVLHGRRDQTAAWPE